MSTFGYWNDKIVCFVMSNISIPRAHSLFAIRFKTAIESFYIRHYILPYESKLVTRKSCSFCIETTNQQVNMHPCHSLLVSLLSVKVINDNEMLKRNVVINCKWRCDRDKEFSNWCSHWRTVEKHMAEALLTHPPYLNLCQLTHLHQVVIIWWCYMALLWENGLSNFILVCIIYCEEIN